MKPAEKFHKAISGKAGQDIPVVLWVNSPFLADFSRVNIKRYYFNSQIKLNSYLKFQETFPDVIIAQGIFPDFGTAVEPASFGGKVVWREDGAPHVKPGIISKNDILKMSPIDISNSELMNLMLEEYKFLWKKLDDKYINDYGYLKNMGHSLGPLETAGLVMGYENFFISLFEMPQQIHKLLKNITEGIIYWLKKQEEINGKLERVYIPDHVPTQLSPELFEEFGFPYMKTICNEFSESIIFWHNEGKIDHIVDKIGELGIGVYHFGHSLDLLKEKIGDKICLMGNVPPIEVLYKKSPKEIKKDCISRLKRGAYDGRFLLSTGGGLVPQTSKENIQAMVDSVNEFIK